jgi:hypothetical protein
MKKSLGTMVAIMVVAILIGTFITAKSSTAGEKARDGIGHKDEPDVGSER